MSDLDSAPDDIVCRDRHARVPGGGSAEALSALALLIRSRPEAFTGARSDLDARRVAALADRQQAVDLLQPALARVPHLAAALTEDPRYRIGERIADLLDEGCTRALRIQAVPPGPRGPDGLARALEVLARYRRSL